MQSIKNIIRVSIKQNYLNAWQVTDSLLVFNQKSGTLSLLDDLAAWLLLSFSEGKSKGDVLHELQPHSIDAAYLERSIAEVESLIGEPAEKPESYSQEYAPYLISRPDDTRLKEGFFFEISGQIFQFISSDAPFFAECSKLFSNRKIEQRDTVQVQLEVVFQEDHYELRCNGKVKAKINHYGELMSHLMDAIQMMIYQSRDYLLAIHSAVVVKDGCGLMLPGLSGSGKSTLSVGLISEGYQCYSDEVAVLRRENTALIAMPLPAAIKAGSWELLETRWPELKAATVWKRQDGRQLKYLALPEHVSDDEFVTVRRIIFPRYDADCAAAELKELNALDALKKLIEAGYQVRAPFTEQKVEQILYWITSQRCYSLTYSSLPQAYQKISGVMQ